MSDGWEYVTLVELALFEGSLTRESLASYLRAARGALTDSEYVVLQRDLKALLGGLA